MGRRDWLSLMGTVTVYEMGKTCGTLGGGAGKCLLNFGEGTGREEAILGTSA